MSAPDLAGRAAAAASDAPDCPMLRLAGFILRAAAAVDAMADEQADSAFRETMAPAWVDLLDRTPETRSADGAAAALRALILTEDLNAEHERVLRSVIVFLDRSGAP